MTTPKQLIPYSPEALIDIARKAHSESEERIRAQEDLHAANVKVMAAKAFKEWFERIGIDPAGLDLASGPVMFTGSSGRYLQVWETFRGFKVGLFDTCGKCKQSVMVGEPFTAADLWSLLLVKAPACKCEAANKPTFPKPSLADQLDEVVRDIVRDEIEASRG